MAAGCGSEPSTARRLSADADCSADAVVLAVYPGAWARLCGCDEGSGAAGAGGLCTFPATAAVRFIFPAPDGRHQLVGDQTGSRFPAGPVITPQADPAKSGRLHFFKAPMAGSYGFVDALGGASGTLIAR